MVTSRKTKNSKKKLGNEEEYYLRPFNRVKIAISGKGGTGKTTFAAALSLLFSKDGKKVISLDCDPDSNLAATLEFPEPEKITPISKMRELILERTESKEGEIGTYFKLNPKVDDIPEKYFSEHNGIKLAVMGGIKKAGTGCYCPESAFLRALLGHLLLGRDDVVILDMEAGIEHLTRGTSQAVDFFIVVVEPTGRSIETVKRIKVLAEEFKIKNVFVVGNKIRNDDDVDFIREKSESKIFGFIKYEPDLRDGLNSGILAQVEDIRKKLIKVNSEKGAIS